MLDRGNDFYVQGNGYDKNVMFWDINEPVGSFSPVIWIHAMRIKLSLSTLVFLAG